MNRIFKILVISALCFTFLVEVSTLPHTSQHDSSSEPVKDCEECAPVSSSSTVESSSSTTSTTQSSGPVPTSEPAPTPVAATKQPSQPAPAASTTAPVAVPVVQSWSLDQLQAALRLLANSAIALTPTSSSPIPSSPTPAAPANIQLPQVSPTSFFPSQSSNSPLASLYSPQYSQQCLSFSPQSSNFQFSAQPSISPFSQQFAAQSASPFSQESSSFAPQSSVSPFSQQDSLYSDFPSYSSGSQPSPFSGSNFPNSLDMNSNQLQQWDNMFSGNCPYNQFGSGMNPECSQFGSRMNPFNSMSQQYDMNQFYS